MLTASVAEGFRDACMDHGIPVDAADMAYYVEVLTAAGAETTPRLVELALKAKSKWALQERRCGRGPPTIIPFVIERNGMEVNKGPAKLWRSRDRLGKQRNFGCVF
jgi:hypothetical protein